VEMGSPDADIRHIEATIQGYEHEAIFLRSLIDTLHLSSWDMISQQDATYQKLIIEHSTRI
jgi:hypothetical protein